MRREEADGGIAASQPRGEIEKTFLGGGCQEPGEVRYRGAYLCRPHAALLELEDRAEASEWTNGWKRMGTPHRTRNSWGVCDASERKP